MAETSVAPLWLEKQRTFADFSLDSRIFKAVAKLGHIYPTLIQAECIPLAGVHYN